MVVYGELYERPEPVAPVRYSPYIKVMTAEQIAQPYAKPPIVEAILEIRLASEISEAKCKKARDRLASRYSNSITEAQAEATLDIPKRTATFVDKPPVYRLTSQDQTDLCLLTVVSMAWVRRAPYEGWEAFTSWIAREMPNALKDYGNPKIARVGLRYVNRIDVKLVEGLAHYEDYLKFRISHGELLEPTSGFQWLLVKEFPDSGLKAIVQSAVLEPEVPGSAAFSFDIDVFCDSEVPQKAEEIISALNAMRLTKNSIFEAGITDRAREVYQ